MTELFRLVQSQMSDRYSQRATSSEANADALDKLLEEVKPSKLDHRWDLLIATPFRYPLPINPMYTARFRPPNFNRNTWYGCLEKETTVYEISFHFLKQRAHLDINKESGLRTLFVCECNLKNTNDICSDQNIRLIMDRHNYKKSHEIAKKSTDHTGIIYPSCRDPQQRASVVMYELSEFNQSIKNEWTIHYEYQDSEVNWFRHGILNISTDWLSIK